MERAAELGMDLLALDLRALWEEAASPDEGVEAARAVLARRPADWQEPAHRRVLVHSSGIQMSPWADIKPAGEDAASPGALGRALDGGRGGRGGAPSRALWHRSPGSPG